MDPSSKVLWARCFDTYISSTLFDQTIIDIPDGYIVAVACKDEFMTSLSESGKKWFESMGSKKIRDV